MTPVLTARVGIAAVGDEPIHAIALRCQVRIEPMRRGYSDEEAAGLLDLFGPRERWATTQRNFLWLQTTAMVQGFTGATQVDLPLECTYDFEVAASKYLHALRDGAVPLRVPVQRNGFHRKATRGFAVQQVPWDREDRYEMPVSVWHDLMRLHYPNTGWLRLDQRHHRRAGGLQVGTRACSSFDDAVTSLLRREFDRGDSDDRRLGSRPRRRRRGALRGLSALPVPGQLAKEPVALAVRRAGAARAPRTPASARTTRCRRRCWSAPQADPSVSIVVRFLQLQHRGVEQDVGGGRFEPVDELICGYAVLADLGRGRGTGDLVRALRHRTQNCRRHFRSRSAPAPTSRTWTAAGWSARGARCTPNW